MKAIGSVLITLVTLPIWLFLLYRILVRSGAGELDFFLFWVYIPVIFIATILIRLADKK